MRKLTGHKAIKAAMRRNEVEVLAHLRGNNQLIWPGNAWYNALERLETGRMIRRIPTRFGGRWRVRKGARPVTGAVR